MRIDDWGMPIEDWWLRIAWILYHPPKQKSFSFPFSPKNIRLKHTHKQDLSKKMPFTTVQNSREKKHFLLICLFSRDFDQFGSLLWGKIGIHNIHRFWLFTWFYPIIFFRVSKKLWNIDRKQTNCPKLFYFRRVSWYHRKNNLEHFVCFYQMNTPQFYTHSGKNAKNRVNKYFESLLQYN